MKILVLRKASTNPTAAASLAAYRANRSHVIAAVLTVLVLYPRRPNVMNAFAFAAQADGGLMTAGGVVLGVAIPALIYCLTRIGAGLYIDCHSRA